MREQCEQHRERFSEYVDGGLPREQRRALEEHLAACPDCARRLESLRQTVGVVRELPRRAAPADLAARVTGRLRQRRRAAGQARHPLLWRVLPVAAMLCIVLGVVFFVRKNGVYRRPQAGEMLALSRERPAKPPAGAPPTEAEERPTEPAPPVPAAAKTGSPLGERTVDEAAAEEEAAAGRAVRQVLLSEQAGRPEAEQMGRAAERRLSLHAPNPSELAVEALAAAEELGAAAGVRLRAEEGERVIELRLEVPPERETELLDRLRQLLPRRRRVARAVSMAERRGARKAPPSAAPRLEGLRREAGAAGGDALRAFRPAADAGEPAAPEPAAAPSPEREAEPQPGGRVLIIVRIRARQSSGR